MSNENTVQVWDILVRIFHWSLVAAFAIAYFTSEEENIWHIYSGYAVLGLICFRVVWGIIGTRYARFTDFIYSPGVVFNYIKELTGKNPTHYTGHNPAGGWMIIALLASLFVVTTTGLKLYAVEEGLGPLAGVGPDFSIINKAHADRDEHDDDDEHKGGENGKHEQEEEFWEEIHEASTNVTLLLIILHIAGVVVAGRLHKENLVKAMITGKKNV
jgi:cytochrome b